MHAVFSKGFDGLIVVGNDTPGLSCGKLLRAAEALKKGQSALGPSADGGFYLLGLQRGWFDRGVFENLPWQKASLVSAIRETLVPKAGPLWLLPTLSDLDKDSDVKLILPDFRNIPLGILKLIQALLPASGQYWVEKQFHYKTVLVTSHYNKGSPLSGL